MKRQWLLRAAFAGLAWTACSPAFALKITPLPDGTPEDVGMSFRRLASLDNVLRKEVKAGHLRGAVLLVARRGKFVHQLAVGMQNDRARLYEDTLYRVYSMTGPLVAVGALKLVEEGKLKLADPVGKYLPPFATMSVAVARRDAAGAPSYETVPAERPITVLDLLRQTSGMVYGETTDNAAVKEAYEQAGLYIKEVGYALGVMTPAEQVHRIAEAPLAYQPGTTWSPGLSTEVLARLIETVAHKRLAEYLEERVFGPLKMKDTAFWVHRRKQGRIAEPFATDVASGQPIRTFGVTEEPQLDSAMGGVSTAGDYLRFCQMLLNGGTLEETHVLKADTLRLMTSDQLGAEIAQPVQPGELLFGAQGYGYGFGLAVRKAESIPGVPGSSGELAWANEAGSFFWVDPKRQLAVVFMTHASRAQGVELRRTIKQIVQQAMTD
jgi:CubicO group peptidase (beta-lactamase class C family)